MRSSIGVDVHRFVEGKSLVIGGVQIDFDRGLKGHSDGDVLTHAIIDSLLGGAALGDIGTHFPSHDDSFKNIDSLILLQKTMNMIQEKGWAISYLDATIIAQTPVLFPYVHQMKNKLHPCVELRPYFPNDH